MNPSDEQPRIRASRVSPPLPEYWEYPTGDVVEVFSYSQMREWEIQQEIASMARDGAPRGRNTGDSYGSKKQPRG